MGLSPDALGDLTVDDFWIKHRAFTRAENRQQAIVIELALRTGEYKDDVRQRLQQDIYALRQYPIKKWHESPQASPDSTLSSEP